MEFEDFIISFDHIFHQQSTRGPSRKVFKICLPLHPMYRNLKIPIIIKKTEAKIK